jgi:Domain of unknown function (DUF4160)
MPEITRFNGIIVTMYWEADEPHQAAHFHVRYSDYRASYSIDPIIQLAGALPLRQQRLLEAWAELHKDELIENWQLVQQGQQPKKIKGLA